MILHGKKIGVNIEDDDSIVDTCLSSFYRQMPTNVNGEEEVDNVLANRNDHDEGELIKEGDLEQLTQKIRDQLEESITKKVTQ